MAGTKKIPPPMASIPDKKTNKKSDEKNETNIFYFKFSGNDEPCPSVEKKNCIKIHQQFPTRELG